MKKGLLVEIMGTDCTNHGVTSGHKQAILVGEGIPEIFEPGDLPVLKLAKGYGTRKYIALPVNKNGGMFGGHFIYSSDSRFPSDAPIHVHDRYEV